MRKGDQSVLRLFIPTEALLDFSLFLSPSYQNQMVGFISPKFGSISSLKVVYLNIITEFLELKQKSGSSLIQPLCESQASWGWLLRSVTMWLLNVSSGEDSTDTSFHPRYPPLKEMEESRYFQEVFNFILG